MSKVLIIGAGAFGIALGQTIQLNGHEVYYLTNKNETANNLKNSFFSGYPKHHLLKPTDVFLDYKEALKLLYDFVVIAIPSEFIEEMWNKLSKVIKNDLIIINSSKGICKDGIWSSIFLNHPHVKGFGLLSGPSFAEEIIEKKKTIVNLVADKQETFNKFANVINNDFFKTIYLPIEFETICSYIGALKNVIAIGMGLIDHLTNSKNTYASFLTFAFEDLEAILKKITNQEKWNLMKPYALGDIILTASTKVSRNYNFGKLIGEHGLKKAFELCKNITVEGLCTIGVLENIEKKHNVYMHFFSPLLKVFKKEIEPNQFINDIWKNIN